MPQTDSTVLFILPDSGEIRYTGEPPRLDSRVRSPSGDVWTVARVTYEGSDTFTVTCVERSRVATVPRRAADQMIELTDDKTVTADQMIELTDDKTVTADQMIELTDDKTVTADQMIELTDDKTLTTDVLRRAKDALSPRAIRRRRRYRDYSKW